MQRSTIYGDWSCMVYAGTMEENKDYEEWDKKYHEFIRKTWNEEWFTNASEEERKKVYDDQTWFRRRWVEEKTLGEFCADGGEVGVFEWNRLSEPDQTWVREHSRCAAVIKNVDGDVNIVVNGEGNERSCHVICEGKTPFFTVQSGF